MSQEQPRPTKTSLNDAFGILNLVIDGHATAITPFIRRRFGSEAFFPSAVVAFAVLLFMTEGRWRNGMGVYLALWLLMLLCRRAETLAFYLRGVVTHSRYAGDPWLAMRFRFVKDEEQARGFEPVMCLMIGAVLCLASPAVGLFVMAGFVSLSLKLIMQKFVVYRRVQQMRDAQIEAEYYAEEIKKGR